MRFVAACLGILVVGSSMAASRIAQADEMTHEEELALRAAVGQATETAQTVHLRVSGPRGVVLERLDDSGWSKVCEVPCAADVAPASSYRVAGADVVPQPVHLPDPPPRDLTIAVKPASRWGQKATKTGAAVLGVVGGLLFAVGAGIVVTHIGRPFCGGLGFSPAATSADADRHSTETSRCEAENRSLSDTRDTGWMTMGVGVVAGLGAAVLLISGGAKTRVVPREGRSAPTRTPVFVGPKASSASFELPVLRVTF